MPCLFQFHSGRGGAVTTLIFWKITFGEFTSCSVYVRNSSQSCLNTALNFSVVVPAEFGQLALVVIWFLLEQNPSALVQL